MSAPTFETWRPRRESVGRPPSFDAWKVGDWLNENRDNRDYVHPSRITMALAVLKAAGASVGREYLHLVALVARAVEPERRRAALSWSHHREVAHLPRGEQNRLLELAEREGLSCPALREVLRMPS
jgi:hypothetical protein